MNLLFRNTIQILMIVMIIGNGFVKAGKNPGIIPKPLEIKNKPGYFIFKNNCQVQVDPANPELKELATLLVERINFNNGPVLIITDKPGKASNSIILSISDTAGSLDNEGYTLNISKHTILIRAKTTNGIFYAINSLMQLLPPEIESTSAEIKLKSYQIPCLEITDKPRFAYRGMHLDVCRHFFPLEFVKKYIDLLASYKMNVFHWHLTDDQGWRIEIKKYPRLNSVGAYRSGTQVAKLDRNDEKSYGGYFTQEQIKEVLAYAAKRYVTVIPEIEMPGHSVAALAAYPHLSCTGDKIEVRTTWGVAEDVFCAGNDSTFIFIEDVLKEVISLFPSPYIHIGGDEVPKTRWQNCPKCQSRIKNENLKDEAGLQSYFIRRIEKFINNNGKKIIGWDEILEGGLAPEATVMSWRGMDGGIEAARQHHDVIMTPGSHCYFDYYQADPSYEPFAIGGYITLSKVYSFEPVPDVLSQEEKKYIIGAQANLWTEYIASPEVAEYMAYPRALALSEVCWSFPENKDWGSFVDRLTGHFKRLDYRNVNYSKSLYDPEINMVKEKNSKGMSVALKSNWENLQIRYTIDGSNPDAGSMLYKNTIGLSANTTLKTALFEKKQLKGRIISEYITVSKAFGKPVKYIQEYSRQYPGQDTLTLVNGIKGNESFKAGTWQGFRKNDMEIIIDLETQTEIKTIRSSFLKSTWSWIFFPKQVEYYISNNGTDFIPAGVVVNKEPEGHGAELKSFDLNLGGKYARYIKIIAVNQGFCPAWHSAAGQSCWLFADEIIIE